MRRVDTKLRAIAAAPAFSGLAALEIRHLATCLDEVEVPGAGYLLLREGKANHTLWLLVEGEAAVSRHGRRLGCHSPGELVGLSSLLDRGPAAATVSTAGPLRALVASTRQFAAMRLLREVDLRLRALAEQPLRLAS